MFFMFHSNRLNLIFVGDGKGTRSMWNDGKQIIWFHLLKLVQDEMDNGLKLIPKLTLEPGLSV